MDIKDWILCSDRLPGDDSDYRVKDGDGEIAGGYYRKDADAWDSCFGWLEREDEDEHPTRLGKVIAWIPLQVRRWIPCSERLPIPEEKVWIQTRRGKVCFAMYEDGTINENDSSWHWYDLPFEKWDEENDCGIIPEGWWEWTEFHPDDEFDCPVDEEVVAWMPLPAVFDERSNYE